MVVSFKRRPQKLGVWNQSLAKQFPNVSFSSWTSPVKTSTASSFVPDGKEILYLEQNQIWSVSVEPAGANLHFGAPQALFTVRPPPLTIGMDPLAVSRDGSRIFFPQEVKPPEDSNAIQIRSGWTKK